MGQWTSSRGSGPDSSTHKRVNPGGASSLLLGTRANSYGCAGSSGSKVVGLLGAGTLIGSSTIGLSDEALSAGAGVTGSFLSMSDKSRSSRSPLSSMGGNMLRSSRSPLSCRGQGICRAIVLLCRVPLGTFWNEWHTSRRPWPAQPFLHAAPLGNLEFPGTPLGEGSPFTPAPPGRAGWSMSQLFSSCAAGTLKAAACWWASSLNLMSLPKHSSLE